jgi:hypothetical protein
MSNIATLPRWKRDSSPGEWLSECAGMAFENPEKWARIALVFNEVDEEGIIKKTRYHSYGIPTNSELIGTLEVGKLLVFDELRGRPG